MKVAQKYAKFSQQKINSWISKACHSQTAMKAAFILSACAFLLLQLSILTILCWAAIVLCIYQLISINFSKMRQRGIIGYLPRTIQIHLLDRSIFDLLCDVWYIPKASQYLKAFIKPFVQNISPEQAATALQDLPENTKKAIMTKGLINIFPNFVQSAIMPHYHENDLTMHDGMPFIKQRDEDTEDQDSLGSTNTTKSTKLQQFEEADDRAHSFYNNKLISSQQQPQSQQQYSIFKQQQPSMLNRENTDQQSPLKEITIRSPSSSHKQLTKNTKHEFSFNNNLFKLSASEPNTFIEADSSSKRAQCFPCSSSSDIDQEDENVHSSSTTFYDIFHNRTTSGSADEDLPKTKLIASSSSQILSSVEDISRLESSQSCSQRPKIADKWDKLELFRNKLKDNCRRLLNGSVKNSTENSNNIVQNLNGGGARPNILHSARQIINMFHKIMELKKMGNLQNIDNKKLIKLFLVSSAFMAAQVATSKRARRWMIHTSLMFLYVLSFLLTTGTLGILAYKYHANSGSTQPAIQDTNKNNTQQIKKKQKQRESVSD